MRTAMLKGILKGIASYIPGVDKVYLKIFGTGPKVSAQYYYSIWLKHLCICAKYGLPTHYETVLELGPGDYLGVGLAALLSGTNKYYALDMIHFTDKNKNLKIFDELVDLFRRREKLKPDLPDALEFLDSNEFPHHILTNQHLEKTLHPERINEVRRALLNLNAQTRDNIQMFYFVPWQNVKTIPPVDLAFSYRVMEHIDDLPYTYESLCRWLKPGGIMAHEIDFRCHQTGKIWNEHWTYSDLLWKIITGKRSYLLNRAPHSTHIKIFQDLGLDIVADLTLKERQGIRRKELSPRFQQMSQEDLTTSIAFIQTIKKDNHSNKSS